MSEQLLLVPEVAAQLHVAPSTLHVWRHYRKGPPSFKVGRRTVYRQQDVDAWIEQQRLAEVAE